MKQQGTLVYNSESERMDVRFGPEDYYGGLHCGETMEVLINGEWTPTRIEMDDDWYLVGVRTEDPVGLIVRI